MAATPPPPRCPSPQPESEPQPELGGPTTTATPSPPPPPPGAQILQVLLDTRPLWPEATTTASLAVHASRALSLLTPPERTAALRFVFPRDAKLALGSALLKRLAVSALLRLPWASSGPPTQDRAVRNGKPFFLGGGVEFNVSHQDGVVALAAVTTSPIRDGNCADDNGDGDDDGDGVGGPADVHIGVDIVSPRERRAQDLETISSHGWSHFISIHAEVLSPYEVSRLEAWPAPSSPGVDPAVNAEDCEERLRAFYSLWCLREAWVKMSGEALMAGWLSVLEFRTFRPPRAMMLAQPPPHPPQPPPLRPPCPPPSPPPDDGDIHDPDTDKFTDKPANTTPSTNAPDLDLRDHELEDLSGEEITERELNIHLHDRKVDTAGVQVRLKALGREFMVCVAARGVPAGVEVGRWRWIGLDEVLDFAESGGGRGFG